MDLDEYRATSLESWNRVATHWERHRDFVWEGSAPVGRRLVERLDPQPGETVLELAAGLGDTGFLAAPLLGPDGRLITSDFSAAMLEAAGRRAAELGIENLEFRQIDAERMELGADSVDGVLCRFGYMLMADPVAALHETRRVLRPGGRLAFAVWADPDSNPWASEAGRVFVQRDIMPPPEPGAPGMFTMADSARIDELVRRAGFERVDVEDLAVEFEYASFDEYWSRMLDLSGAMSKAVAVLTDAERESLRAAVDEQVAAYRANGLLRLPGLARIAVPD
ncbi:MAG: methyltransferase domain-containing protein [Actinomycetota bacterium]|nr:methyltransferase domain-containing protein [Actinomycetota bacterium]